MCVYVCVYLYVCSFLCRAVATDEHHRVAVLSLPADAEIHLSSERASFFLVGVLTRFALYEVVDLRS